MMGWTILVIFSWIIAGAIVAVIANEKGKTMTTWFFYGFLCPPLAIFFLLLSDKSSSNGKYVKCPYCAEFIKKEAKICRYCNKKINK